MEEEGGMEEEREDREEKEREGVRSVAWKESRVS